MLIHQHVPFDPFVRSHQPHHYLGQREARWRYLHQQLVAQLLKLHDDSLTTRSQDYQPLQHGIALHALRAGPLLPVQQHLDVGAARQRHEVDRTVAVDVAA